MVNEDDGALRASIPNPLMDVIHTNTSTSSLGDESTICLDSWHEAPVYARATHDSEDGFEQSTSVEKNNLGELL